MADTLKTVSKNVCGHGVRFKQSDEEGFLSVCALFDAYGSCKDLFLTRFCGIRYMNDVKSWRTLRNQVRKEQKELNNENGAKPLIEQFCIQGRHWVQALRQACSTLNSMWSNTATRIKHCVRDNDVMTAEERAYCYYVLSVRMLWQQVLLKQKLSIKSMDTINELVSALTPEQIKHCNSYIRRKTRQHKPSPRTQKYNTMLLDQEMYSMKEIPARNSHKRGKKNVTELFFMSQVKSKRHRVMMRSRFCYRHDGDILLVLNRDKKTIDIHKSIKTRAQKNAGPNVLGVDKGLATLLSCSSGREYGENFGILSNREAERINERNTNRNRFIQKKKTLSERTNLLNEQINKTDQKTNIEERIRLIREKKALERQIDNLTLNNLGRKHYDREHNRAKEAMTSYLNHEIRRMLEEEDVKVLVKEDLSFTKDKIRLPKGQDKSESAHMSARTRRNLSSWTKGVLNERIEYICKLKGVNTTDVNPAYTSQFCAICGAPLDKRYGAHNEYADCPNCGKVNANTNAGRNILNRLNDDDIHLYTPYKKVKDILNKRYEDSKI